MSRDLLQKCLTRMYGHFWADDLCAEIRAALAQPQAEPDIDALRRVAKELSHYNPQADEYSGRHVHKYWAGQITDAIATPQQAQPAAPNGWVMVPREPFPSQRIVGAVALVKASDSDLDCTTDEIAAAYRAMIAAAPAAPAVPVSWERLRTLMDGIPTREEFIGGQRQQYVAKEAVMGWLYEGQLRAEREAALSAVQPPDERAAFEAWIRKDCGDLETFGRGSNTHYRNSAVNNAWTGWQARAHGIAAPGSAHG